MKKYIFLFLLASFLFILPTGVLAQSEDPTIKEVEQLNEALDAKQSGEIDTSLEGYLDSSMDITSAKLYKMLAGGENADGTTTAGAFGAGIKMIGLLYENPPASTQIYIADLMHNFNIAQPAYAQGLGFSSLSPILTGWKIFRNVAYVFFVLIFLIIGFLIMLRKKVGQAAVTAQQAIPKIIVAMLAVTFSYAIAGFLIDLMYLIMYLLYGLFANQDLQDGLDINQNIFELGKTIITLAYKDGGDAVGNFVKDLIGDDTVIQKGFAWIADLTAGIIFAVAGIYAVFKLFFELLKTYVTILISILMSPLLLMFEAIPGQKHFGKWVQGLIGNLSAFPTVFMVIILYKLLITSTADNGTGFMPPFLLNGLDAGVNSVNLLVGIGLLLGMPEAVKQVKKLLGAGDGGIFGTVLKSGWDEAKQHRAPGMAVGKGLTGLGVAGIGAAGGAGLGALGAGLRGNNILSGAKKGAGYGALAGAGVAAAPMVAPTIYKKGKGMVNALENQVMQAAGKKVYERGEVWFDRRGAASKGKDDEAYKQQLNQAESSKKQNTNVGAPVKADDDTY